ncbi:hypothetical protein B9T26_10465 [Acinetobacter sp. ANC 4169]|jgi:hypothetical protein|uniref:hypothetical protein n=1 Tax=Acinetobacter sp. ANC 4169 TaxID=1977879 RepID=UPI000A353217|nr:hypothetical protein [Acinetobacter sp. ANC 4169]OTG72346.1 hypothetical protein B9T26_10465 [Acinetobacter sp. ANC 4169]
MKLKYLSLSIITAFTLVGCGGGGSDSIYQGIDTGSAQENKDFQQWHYFEIDGGYNDDALSLNYSIGTIDQGKIYDQNNFEYDNDLTITQNGIYQDFGPKDSKYGYFVGTGSFKNLVLTHQHYSPIGSTGLVFTSTYKKIDLSGKNVLATLEPEHQWDLSNEPTVNFGTVRNTYYNRVKDLTFPAGAYCMQQLTYSNNQENLLAYSNGDEKQYFDDYAAQYSQNAQSRIFKKTYKDTVSYLYSSEGTDADAAHGYAEYKGQYYEVARNAKGLQYSLADEIQNEKDNLPSTLTDADRKLAIQRIESQNNLCTWYNDTASTFIQNNMKP